MTTIIDRIGRDHRNMRRLLDLFEGGVEAYLNGKPPDFELLALAADYMLDYPDLIHHPLEDLVFGRLLDRDPEAAALVRGLVEEHVRLARLGQRLAAAIDGAEHDLEISRDWLHMLVQQYVTATREHMQSEEQHLLPRALARLTEEDWAAVDARAGDRADPAFGEKRSAPYLRLHERIMAMAVAG